MRACACAISRCRDFGDFEFGDLAPRLDGSRARAHWRDGQTESARRLMTPSSLFDLSGAVALVTGASSGSGADCARAGAKRGERRARGAAQGKARGARRRDRSCGRPCAPDRCRRRKSHRDRARLRCGASGIRHRDCAHQQCRRGEAAILPRHACRDVAGALDINLNAVVATAQEAARRMVASGERRDRQYRLDPLLRRAEGQSRLRRLEGGRAPGDAGHGARSSRRKACASTPSRPDISRPRSTPTTLRPPGRGDVAPSQWDASGRKASSTARFSCSLHALGASSPARRSWSTAGTCSRLRSGEASLSCGRTPIVTTRP